MPARRKLTDQDIVDVLTWASARKTIADVAAEKGVSPRHIKRILSDPTYRLGNANKVDEALEELGFHVNSS